MLPAWLMPGAPPEAAPSRLIGAPRLSARNRRRDSQAGAGCTALVTWRLQSVSHLEGAAGELTLAQLTSLTGCTGPRIGSCLAKLQAQRLVRATDDRRGRGYRWVGGE